MGRLIVLIDDSMLFLELERGILEREGYQVRTATNGRQGLEISRREQPDLILLDINMPVMNGFEFLIFARNDDRLRTIPIIVVTTKGRDTDVKYALKIGADDYITKPIDDNSLLDKVRLILGDETNRLDPRKSVSIPVELNDFESVFEGSIIDLSRGGVLISCERELALNRKVELSFQLPFEGTIRAVRSFGRVISCIGLDDLPGPHFEIRIQFINLRRENQTFIEDLINRDVKSIASFLLSSPVQRRDFSEETSDKPQTPRDLIGQELDGLLSDYYRIDEVFRQLFDKFEKMKKHLKQSQLEFHDLDCRYTHLAEDYHVLANLFIATYRLLSGATVGDVVEMMSELLENIVCAESFDIFLRASDGQPLVSCSPRTNTGDVSQGDRVMSAMATGEIYLREQGAGKSSATDEPEVVIPLKVNSSVLGCIVVQRIVPQNNPMTMVSRKLIDMLYHHGGIALTIPVFLASDEAPVGFDPALLEQLHQASLSIRDETPET